MPRGRRRGREPASARACRPSRPSAHLFVAWLAPAACSRSCAAFAADRSRAPRAAIADGACRRRGARRLLALDRGRASSSARDIPATLLLWGVPVAAAALLRRRERPLRLPRARLRALERAARPAPAAGSFSPWRSPGFSVAAGLFASPGAPGRAAAAVRRFAPTASDRRRRGRRARARRPGADAGVAGFETLLSTGARPAGGRRDAASPPEIWIDSRDGRAAGVRHGVRALERVRPAGSPTALRPPLGHRPGTCAASARPRGSSASAPVSAADRRRLAFWEVSASAGLPSAAVGWWASGPWPGAAVVGNEEVLARRRGRARTRTGSRSTSSRAAPEGGQQVSTVYLPGPDILRADAGGRAGGRADRVYLFLEERGLAGASRAATALVVLAADSHARATGLSAGWSSSTGRRTRQDCESGPRTSRPRSSRAPASPAPADLPGRPVAALFPPGIAREGDRRRRYGPRIAPAAALAASDASI